MYLSVIWIILLCQLLYFSLFRRGSVIADTEVQYNYPNNDSQIHFLNTGLKSTLLNILNNTYNLNNISQAFGNVSIEVRNIALQPTEIMSEYCFVSKSFQLIRILFYYYEYNLLRYIQ